VRFINSPSRYDSVSISKTQNLGSSSQTPADLEAARDRLVPDVVSDGLHVLFCGINPGLMTAATGHHFARPGNRFWPVLLLCTSLERVRRGMWLGRGCSVDEGDGKCAGWQRTRAALRD
jgi:hypothetical protein